MTLIISNAEVAELLTMKETIAALEKAYADLVAQEAVCRPRIDIQIPTSDPHKVYQWGTMEGGSAGGYFAVRMKSDVVTEQGEGAARTQEKYCTRPGLYCGLILLTRVDTGEPLAFINDGHLQHVRVGADGGIGIKRMARADAKTVGMLGSGGMARSHMDAFVCVRPIERLKVYSPTPANREAYAAEMRARHGIEVIVCDDPREVYRGVDILAGCTDAAAPVIEPDWIEPGTHVLNVGGGSGILSPAVMEKVDVYFRFGNAPAPWGLPHWGVADEYVTWAARPDHDYGFRTKRPGRRGHGVALPDRVVYMADILAGSNRGRTSRDQITYSERGNLQGAQFFAVAGLVYEKARERGMGREIPTEWFLQDIRD